MEASHEVKFAGPSHWDGRVKTWVESLTTFIAAEDPMVPYIVSDQFPTKRGI